MPKLTIEGQGEFEVPAGTRLVNALTKIAGTDQLHACGGKCRCTTCRVEFIAGEPSKMTEAEQATLSARGIDQQGVRLSCQILCEQDQHIKLISRLEGSGRADQGGACSDAIEPEPQWVEKS
ncbi:2Fe-2S iron-sulfur cluster-binding protein [Rosistilla oblonga]|uniref:2Fe-2S iron-sulfur cluster-binding protein n=1 Tax=Rosistilla oblonga TaxID=2527990 RepID=UPI003A983D4D